MDSSNGYILTPEQVREMKKLWSTEKDKELKEETKKTLDRLVEMEIPPTYKQMARKPPKVGRNEPCPCNSGKKFKKCCLSKM